jgi:hypothetical protein
MDEYRLPETLCPDCGHHLDAAANLTSQSAPQIGAVTVCHYCSAVLRFCAEDQLQKISDDELVEMALQNPRAFSRLVKVQNASESAMKNKKTESFINTDASYCCKKAPRRRRRRKNEPTGLKGRVEP